MRYFGVFLTTAGANANIPAVMAYQVRTVHSGKSFWLTVSDQANNIRGQWKRAFCSALLVGFGGIGGIAGSLVFRSQDAPEYRPGIIAAMACNGLIIVIVATLSIHFRICNRKVRDGQMIVEGLHGFMYTL